MFILIFICLIAVAINSSDELLGILTVVVGWQHWQAQKLKQRLEFLELFQLRELSTRIKALELELDQRRATLEPEAQRDAYPSGEETDGGAAKVNAEYLEALTFDPKPSDAFATHERSGSLEPEPSESLSGDWGIEPSEVPNEELSEEQAAVLI